MGYPARMKLTRGIFIPLVGLVPAMAATPSCTNSDDPAVVLDASTPDVRIEGGAESDASGAADAPSQVVDGGPNDAAVSDTGVNSDAQVDSGETLCDRAVDAGGAVGCSWLKVTACGGSMDFHAFCGANRRANHAWRCNDSPFQLDAGAGPVGSPDYRDYLVHRCPDEACPTDLQHASWRCIECCPK